MKGPEESNKEIKALRQRMARLGEASLRISASLDVSTLLREVVDSARALTPARYGVIATIVESGHSLGPAPPASRSRGTASWRAGPASGTRSSASATCPGR